MNYFLFFLTIILLFLIIYFRIYLFLVRKNRLPILMYHKVLPNREDSLTVSVENLEKQFQFLKENNYETLFFTDLEKTLQKKSIIITFDDGYKNNEQYLLPLLKKYELKATIFIPTKFIEEEKEGYMTFKEIKNLHSGFVEIALHSHSHENFTQISLEEIEKNLQLNIQTLERHQINFTKVLAYPYGKFPSKKAEFFKILEKLQIIYAVRIGNKINYFPTQKPFELKRIEVKGHDNLQKFKMKLIFGKLKLF